MPIVEEWILLGMESGKGEQPYWASYRSGRAAVRTVDLVDVARKRNLRDWCSHRF